MPIYIFECEKCKGIKETIQTISEGTTPTCCGTPMRKLPTSIALFKMKGMGGYPSLRKAIQGNPETYVKDTKRKVKNWV